jgi:hypothetical protein
MKFYFQTQNGVCYPDNEGTELADAGAAKIEAVKVLADFLGERPADLWQEDFLELTVQDERRKTLFVLQVAVVPAADPGNKR